MKIFILLLSLSFSLGVLAQELNGGQTGNGGNGCWFHNDRGDLTWKTVEELKYDIIFAQYNVQSQVEENEQLRIRANGLKYQVNMKDFTAVKRALRRLSKLSSRFPEVYQSIRSYAYLLESVTVVQNNITGVYEGDLSQLRHPCISFGPAMLTVEQNKILLVRPIWNSINVFTAEIVIVHELIRFAQLFAPAFYDLTNDDLQKLTALLFSRKNYLHPHIYKILEPIEARLN